LYGKERPCHRVRSRRARAVLEHVSELAAVAVDAAITEHSRDTNLILGGDATIMFRADDDNRRGVVSSSNPNETVSRAAAR
jgi:hypothetical protein